LILEIGDLKERIVALEKELNPEPIPVKQIDPDIIKLQGEGYEKLGNIYREGYHVCPIAFGQYRDGECLFCIAFMEKE